MSSKTRLGVYGGTFSPPHLGHVGAAKSFYGAVPLDKLLIIPDFLPPHKQIDGEISADDRIEMCKLAFADVKGAEVSDIEIKRGGKSYTALTLAELSSDENELYFLCGTDMFLTLGEWYKPEEIFKLATICFVRRENDKENDLEIQRRTEEYINRFSARIIQISAPVTEISSSELRLAIKEDDERLVELLPSSVLKYIKERGLYR